MSDEPRTNRPILRCFIVLPFSPAYAPVKAAIQEAAKVAGFRAAALEGTSYASGNPLFELIANAIARADCVIADLSSPNPNVFFELGMAKAMGKPLFFLRQNDSRRDLPSDIRGFSYLAYEPSVQGLSEMTRALASALLHYRRAPRPIRSYAPPTYTPPFEIEWDRLAPRDAENLCLELLTQMNYRNVNWYKGAAEVDLVAELPRRDPDGYEYRELWLVMMGRKPEQQRLFEVGIEDTEYLLYRVFRETQPQGRGRAADGSLMPVTLLYILLKSSLSAEELDLIRAPIERRYTTKLGAGSVRVRVWDRTYLTSLVQKFPQIGYKYFSDEARSQAEFRKTQEQLYRENVQLTDRQATLISELQEEKNQRARAERDAAWKDIAFTAAHKLGNPIFAIETNLGPLRKRVIEVRTDEALSVINDIEVSVEKAKCIIDQFKSLTRAQQMNSVPTPLLPIVENACRGSENSGVEWTIDCPSDLIIRADPDRLSECFDELVANSLQWFDKPHHGIQVHVQVPAPDPLPEGLDAETTYALVNVRDDGIGIPVDIKSRVFDAFFTTREHGTGLGLAVVRRIIEGHGGSIFETGVPGEGVDFVIHLPIASQQKQVSTHGKQSSRRRKEKE